jgi:phosphoribosyl-AMP cyclohydrolase
MVSAVAVLLSFEDNVKWLSRNYEWLKGEFNGEWVAVLGKTVVDHDGDLAVLVKRLKEKHSRTYNKIAVDYVTTKEVVSIF